MGSVFAVLAPKVFELTCKGSVLGQRVSQLLLLLLQVVAPSKCGKFSAFKVFGQFTGHIDLEHQVSARSYSARSTAWASTCRK